MNPFKINGPLIYDIAKALIFIYRYLTRPKENDGATDSQDRKNLKESQNETQTNE